MIALKKSHPKQSAFHIVRAFEALDGARKLALVDSLTSGSKHTFQNTVHLLWPEASKVEAFILEKFILRRMAANDS